MPTAILENPRPCCAICHECVVVQEDLPTAWPGPLDCDIVGKFIARIGWRKTDWRKCSTYLCQDCFYEERFAGDVDRICAANDSVYVAARHADWVLEYEEWAKKRTEEWRRATHAKS